MLFTNGDSIDEGDLKYLDRRLPDVKKIVVTIQNVNDIYGGFTETIVVDKSSELWKVLGTLEKLSGRVVGKCKCVETCCLC